MAFINKDGLQHLTNKLVKAENIKVASLRGSNIKEVIDNIQRECDNVAQPNTMIIENNVSEFKIGKGKNIDVSGDVEEGRVEVELKGKTWFDVVDINSFKINQEQALEYRYQYFGIRTKPNFEQHGDKTYFRLEFEKIQMDNDDNTTCVLSHRDDGGYTIRILNNSQLKSKPFNTPITVSMIRTRNTNEGGTYQSFFIQNFGEFTHNIQFKFKVLGCVCINLTQYFGKGKEPTKEWCDKNIPYFTGIKSSFEDGIVDVEVIEHDNPNNKKKISFDIGEPLKSLPDGTSDEIINNNGQWELIRRVAKVEINPNTSLNLVDSQTNENTVYCNCYNSYLRNRSTPMISSLSPYLTIWNKDIEGTDGDHRTLSFRINKNRLQNLTSEDCKDYLIKNNTTVYYGLETPTITPIEPIEFDIKPLSIMSIKSDIAPNSTHTVILNRSGQIEQGIELIAKLRNKIDNLEREYDNNLLNTQLQINNLKLNLKLKGDK